MNREAMPELRILTGTHAGARALLGDGGQTVGSGADCDFILSDDGVADQHVRVECQQDGSVMLHWLNSEDEEAPPPPQRLEPGEDADVGPIKIAIDAANAPWPGDLQDQPVAMRAVKPEEPPAAAPSEQSRQSPPEEEPKRAMPSASAAALWVGVVLGATCLVAAGAMWWASASTPSSIDTPSVPRAAPMPVVSEASKRQREQALAIVAKLGMTSRVSVEAIPGDAPLQVRAALLSEEDAEILAMGLAGLSPRPALRMGGEREMKLAVGDALQRHSARLQTRLTARYLGEGRFIIEGRVPDAAAKLPILQALRKDFGEVRAFEDGMRTSAEQADAMVDDLRGQGIEGVHGEWIDGSLAIRVRLAPADVPRWEKALQAAAARYEIPFKATLELSADAPPIAAKLPMRIRSVVSGETPYLVLGDGGKLFVEGRHAGWRLVGIGPQNMVFEDPQQRRVVVDR